MTGVKRIVAGLAVAALTAARLAATEQPASFIVDPANPGPSSSLIVGTTNPNQPPDVWAESFNYVHQGGEASLSGTASDPDGDAVAMSWGTFDDPNITSNGSVVTVKVPRDTPTGTVYRFTFSASDGEFTVSAPESNIVVINEAPEAWADSFGYGHQGEAAFLSGTASDPEGDEITAVWTQVGGPSVSFSQEDTVLRVDIPLSATTGTSYVFRLTATDEHGADDFVESSVTVENQSPEIFAGPLSFVESGQTVLIEGTASDPDGDEVTVSWSGPGVSGQSGAGVLFTAPYVSEETSFELEFVARDDFGGEDRETLTVVVLPGDGPPPQSTVQLELNDAPPEDSVVSGAFVVGASIGRHVINNVVTDFSATGGPAALSAMGAATADMGPGGDLSTAVGTPINVTLSAVDPDGDPVSYGIHVLPARGTAALVGPNVVRYTPDDGFEGVDGFVVRMADGRGGDALGAVNVLVGSPSNAAPTGSESQWTLGFGGTLVQSLSAADADSGTPVLAMFSPLRGSAGSSGWTMTYSPAPGFSGHDFIPWRATDGANFVFFVDHIEVAPPPMSEVKAWDGDPDEGGQELTTLPPQYGEVGFTIDTNELGVSDGEHEFYFVGRDAAGDRSKRRIRLKVDNTAPQLVWESYPGFPGNGAPVSGKISMMVAALDNLAADPDDNILFVKVQDPKGGGSTLDLVRTDSFGRYALLDYDTRVLSDGVHTFRLLATDRANNAASSISFSVRVDNSAPSGTIAINPEPVVVGDEAVVRDRITVTVEGFDVEETAVDISLNNGATQNPLVAAADGAVQVESSFDTLAYPDGAWEVRVSLRDEAGNVSLLTSPVVIDNTPPSVDILAPADQALIPSLSDVRVTADDLHGASVVDIRIGGTPVATTFVAPDRYVLGTPLTAAGAKTLTVQARDGAGNVREFQRAFTILAGNRPPEALSQSVSLDEDTATAINLTAVDPDGQTAALSIESAPAHGILSGTAPALIYTPASNFHGADSFTFSAHDGQAASNIATVNLTVRPINDLPVATPQAVTLNEDASLAVTLSAFDADGDTVNYRITAGPSAGQLTGERPLVTYAPDGDYNGPDSFRFVAEDAAGPGPEAVISLEIQPMNDLPVAIGQSVAVAPAETKSIVLRATDVDSDELVYSIITPPANGSLTGELPNPTYTPSDGFEGADFFEFHAHDGTGFSNAGRVNVAVSGTVNRPPVAMGQALSTPEDTPIAITLTGADDDLDDLGFEPVDLPMHGSITGEAPNLVYTPDTDYSGPDRLTFKANDGLQDSLAAAEIIIDVMAVNDTPTAANVAVTVNRNAPTAITLSGSDVETASLGYAPESGPSHGTLGPVAGSQITYIPALGYVGADSFTYRSSDGNLLSAPATVSITVVSFNNPPTVPDVSVQTEENVPVALDLTGSDLDGDDLTYARVTEPARGTLSGTFPLLTYTPNDGYAGPDSFTYEARDGLTNSAVGTVSIVVTSVDTAPAIESVSLSNGAFVKGIVPIQATVNDDSVGTPEVSIRADDGAPVPMNAAGGNVFTHSWNTDELPEGAHTVAVLARDANGKETVLTVSVTIDRTAPSVTAFNVAENETMSGVRSIQANLSDAGGSLVSAEIIINGTVSSLKTLTGTSGVITYSLDTTVLANGTHQIAVRSTDAAGNVRTVSRSVTVTNGVVEPLPDFEVLNPRADAAISGAVTLRLRMLEGTALSVGYSLDGGALLPLSEVQPGVYERLVSFAPPVVDGFHTLEFAVTGAAGTRRRTVQIRVDNTAPVVTITAPQAGRKLYLVQSLVADAWDNGNVLDTVSFRINGTSEIALFEGNPDGSNRLYSFLFDTEALDAGGSRRYPDGAYTLTVIARDQAGNASQAVVPFSIDNINIPLSDAEVVVRPAPGAFTVTDAEATISAKIIGIAVKPEAVNAGSLRVFVDKDGFRLPGGSLPQFDGVVQLTGDTIHFTGNVPANAVITCQLLVPDVNEDIIRVTWSFKRAMSRAVGGSVTNGEFSVFFPPQSLRGDAFVSIQSPGVSEQVDEANRSFESIFDGYKQMAGPYHVAAELRDGTFDTILDQDAFLTFSRPLGNIPPQDRSFVPQLQKLVAGSGGSLWQPLGVGNLSTNASDDANGSSTVSVRTRQLGIFRVAGFAAPTAGISEFLNYPNPFMAGDEPTRFLYMLGADSEVTIVIYDLLGNLVRKMEIPSGADGGRANQNSILWDGRNGAGDVVANGGYIVQVIAKDGNGSISRIRHKVGVVK